MTAEQRPAFVTAEECRAWMAATPLGNATQALSHMLRQLNLLNRHTVDVQERLAILELVRKPLLLAQAEGAKRFVGKALPLVPPEQAAFDSAQVVWQALLTGYGLCIQAETVVGTTVSPRLGVLLQRALASLAGVQLDIYRAGFEPTPQHWRTLHELYGIAERTGVATTEVEDTARQGKALSSPHDVYAEVLLLHAASPHELSTRHLVWVARWARRWARKAIVLAAPPALDGESVPLNINLAGTEPAGYHPASGPGARWMDTAGIRKSIKKRLNLLEKGTLPCELQLGEDCTQPDCGQVLKQIYQRWCRGGSARRHERHAASGICKVVAGVEGIYFHVSDGQVFRQPGYANDEALRRERDEMATFGRVAPRSLAGTGQHQGHRVEEWNVVEEWQMIDESATGLHATHALGASLARVSQRQLVGVRPPNAQGMLIGSLRWSMVTGDARLHVGILILPGRPEGIAVRTADNSGVREPYRPGFLLPAVPAVSSGASIITPPAYFRVGRILEIMIGQKTERVRLLQLIDHGLDFDRASYEAA
jgi:cyclic-di-GMP-binding protein